MSGTESLIDSINDDCVWQSFIERRSRFDPDDSDVKFFKRMFEDAHCRSVCESISDGTYAFSVPRKKLIPKNRGSKMRAVYQFKDEEMMALKLISDLLYRYDYLFSPGLYSFRRNRCAGAAVRRLFDLNDLGGKWGYKADIHDYFNSIDVGRLLPRLKTDLSDDRLYALIESILSNPEVIFNNEIICEQKGVMAGIPISAFLANYYLKDVDLLFESLDCVYMRYADDILILADSEETIMSCRTTLLDAVGDLGLEMNPEKEFFFHPGEKFEFLGFSISEQGIDISENTVRKMKGKIRRSSRSIRRWMLDRHAPVEGTIRALIREYNRRFYGREDGELSWSAWYLSTITTTKSIHEIDLYFQDWIRYVATGRHSKKNRAAVPYEIIRRCGYRPLVSEYYNGANAKRFET